MDGFEAWQDYNEVYPNTITLDVFYSAVERNEDAVVRLLVAALDTRTPLSDSDLQNTPDGVYL